MGQPKFKSGDRVQMTAEGRARFPSNQSYTGYVVGSYHLLRQSVPGCVRVKRDGLKTADTWDENLWEPLTTTQQ